MLLIAPSNSGGEVSLEPLPSPLYWKLKTVQYRLRNHGTSDGRTWTTPRAAASCVALATSQGRAGAVGDVH